MSDEESGGDGGDLQFSDNGLFSEAAGLEEEAPAVRSPTCASVVISRCGSIW